MSAFAGPGRDRPEQLIGALIPPIIQRPCPAASLVPDLPPGLGLPTSGDVDSVVLDMARLDASGRFSARRLLQALGWEPGHRVDAVVVDDAVIVRSSPTGLQIVGSRSEFAVPAAVRVLAGIGHDGHLVLAAVIERDVLLVPAHVVVTRLLLEHYAELAKERHRR